MGTAGTTVQVGFEPGLQHWQHGSAATRKARKSRPYQFLETDEGSCGITWKHADRRATPFGKAERLARPHGYVREVEFSAQLAKDTFHKIALSG